MQLKTKQMEDEQDFYIPVPPIIEESEISEVLLTPEVVERINSLKSPEDLKAGFREILLSCLREDPKIDQLKELEKIERSYLRILSTLNIILNDKDQEFEHHHHHFFVKTRNETKALECFKKEYPRESQISDLFIKQVSKEERYQHFKMMGWSEENNGYWVIYIIGTIDYSQENKKTEKIEETKVSEVSLAPEVIEEINSLNASKEFKDFACRVLLANLKISTQEQLNDFTTIKNSYLSILNDLIKALDNNEKSFKKWLYLKSIDLESQVCDFFIEQLSKQELYKNPKLLVVECISSRFPYWGIDITCDIEYP